MSTIEVLIGMYYAFSFSFTYAYLRSKENGFISLVISLLLGFVGLPSIMGHAFYKYLKS